jgi:two-component system chemotaxis sensor kinase CheA
MDPVLVLRSLSRLGEIVETRLERSRLPQLAALDPELCFLAWNLQLATDSRPEDIRDLFAFVEDGSEISIEEEIDVPEEGQPAAAPAASPKVRESSSIRVSTEKVDRLIDLVGELVIAQSMAAQILAAFHAGRLPELQEAFDGIERRTRELQERVMGIRMLPVGTVFSRFPRLVHDLSAASGKQITLEMTGEDIELDKGVVERLSDPLTHLVRNAIDHGIEPSTERHAAGKQEQATVWLRAFHQGGNVIVEVADDGRGLDTSRIRKKAIERGLLAGGDALEEREIQALIFEPGFSTAEQVTDLSGRGVGMDVVKRSVEGLNGSVSIESEAGHGTRIRMRLPLTLAILDGLLLRVAAERYVLPLTQILESIRPHREQCKEAAGRGEVVVVRGEPVALVRMHRLFGVSGAVTDPSQGLVVLVEHQGHRMALLVDELLGQQQVVIKSLEAHFRKVDGVAGATILGDGRAALILDVAGLAQMLRAGAGHGAGAGAEPRWPASGA